MFWIVFFMMTYAWVIKMIQHLDKTFETILVLALLTLTVLFFLFYIVFIHWLRK